MEVTTTKHLKIAFLTYVINREGYNKTGNPPVISKKKL
jgi:hypothetical protein